MLIQSLMSFRAEQAGVKRVRVHFEGLGLRVCECGFRAWCRELRNVEGWIQTERC